MVLLKGRQNKEVFESRVWEYINFVDGPYEALESDVCKYPDDFITSSYLPTNQKYPSVSLTP